MMRSLFSGVSGLKNHQTRMDVIGNNISNVNTTGFKSSRTTFADQLSQTLTGSSGPTENLGGVNAKQIGLGSSVASIDMIFTDGSVQSTGKNTDLCLSGNGLFVVKRGDQTYYTRDGAFEFDAAGNYVLPGSGLLVQGWMGAAGANGEWEINTNAATTAITVQAGQSMPATMTTKATYSGNLDAENSTGAKITTTVTAYDSQGFKYSVPLIFEKTGTNTWSVTAGTVAGAGSVNITGGSVSFTTVGVQPASTTSSNASITITSGAGTPLNIDLDLSSITQFANESTVHAENDGYTSGTLESISIDSSGIITGVYTNGERRQEAQVAVAQFANSTGLTKTGNSLYQESNNSGSANIKTASALGVAITPSALEMSNVDVANEFADMIITQRGFQSNSKIVTVGDEMLETVINMKR